MKLEDIVSSLNPLLTAIVKANEGYQEEVKGLREELKTTTEELQKLKETVGTSPAPAPKPEPTPDPKPEPEPTPIPEVPKTGAVKINDFDGGDWLNGVWIKDDTRRISIPKTDLFTVGDEVTLADGEPRRVKVVENVGDNISLELTGGKIDPNTSGAPNNITKVADGDPSDLPAPGPEQPAPIPEVPEPTPKPTPGPVPSLAPFPFLGNNLAGAEFGSNMPGTMGQDYGWPKENDWKMAANEGWKIIRLPFKWERIQREYYKDLHGPELAQMDQALAWAEKYGIQVNLDMHNYFGRKINGTEHRIGTAQVPLAAWLDVWKRLASRYANHKALWAFGVMNEPRGTNGEWWLAAQKAYDVIYSVAPNKWQTFCGDGYANAHGWVGKNKNIDKFKGKMAIFEAHVYFDGDHKGTYGNRGEQIPGDIGVRRAQDFLKWLRDTGNRGFIGETSAPENMPTAQTALINFLEEMRRNNVPVVYWAAGSRWSASAANGIQVRDSYREPISKIRRYKGVMLPFVGPVKMGDVAPTNPTDNVQQPAPADGTVQLNGFSGGDWENGVWIADGAVRVSIPNTAGFDTGSYVKLADGIERRVTHKEPVGNNFSLNMDGPKLDPKVVGYPGVVTQVNKG